MDNIEVERKWLISEFPRLPEKSEELQEQRYLAFDPVTVRVRKVYGAVAKENLQNNANDAARYWLTFKSRGGLARTEVELPLSAAQYAALLPMAAAPAATKRLRRYSLGQGLELECSLVDEGEDGAFYYAEVEFASEEQAALFSPPPFLGQEVTGKAGYSMSAHCRRKAAGGAGPRAEK